MSSEYLGQEHFNMRPAYNSWIGDPEFAICYLDMCEKNLVAFAFLASMLLIFPNHVV